MKAAGRARVPGEPAWVSERPSRLDPRSPLPLSALFPLSLGARFQDALVQSLSPPTFCREGTVALRGGAISLRYQLNVLQLLRAMPESGARGDEAAWPWTPDRTPLTFTVISLPLQNRQRQIALQRVTDASFQLL